MSGMAVSRKQQQAAGIELSKRRAKKVKKQRKGKATRPFGSTTLKTIKEIASGPIGR